MKTRILFLLFLCPLVLFAPPKLVPPKKNDKTEDLKNIEVVPPEVYNIQKRTIAKKNKTKKNTDFVFAVLHIAKNDFSYTILESSDDEKFVITYSIPDGAETLEYRISKDMEKWVEMRASEDKLLRIENGQQIRRVVFETVYNPFFEYSDTRQFFKIIYEGD